MIALLNAIYTKFTGTVSLTTAFPGGLFRDRAAEGTPMPFAITTVISTPSDAMYGSNRRGQAYIRFSAVGVGHDAIGTAMETLVSVFDDAILTLGAGAMYEATRITDPIPMLEPPVDGSGNEVWRWSVDYRYSVRT